jgi:hypothetical protein
MTRNMSLKGPKIMELWSKTIQHSKFVKLLSKFSPTQTAQFHFVEVTTSFFSHHAKLCMLDIYMSFFFFWKFLISEIQGFFKKLCKIIWIYTRKKNPNLFPNFLGQNLTKFVHKTHFLCKLDIICRPRSKVQSTQLDLYTSQAIGNFILYLKCTFYM